MRGAYMRMKRDDVLLQLAISITHFLHVPGISPLVLEMGREAPNGRIGFVRHEANRDLEAYYRVIPGGSPGRPRDQTWGNIALILFQGPQGYISPRLVSRPLEKNQAVWASLERGHLRVARGEMCESRADGTGHDRLDEV